MGVYVDGVWHEELADPNPEGGSNLSSGGGGGGSAPAQDPRAVGTNEYGDGIFNTPNGQKTGTQIAQELRNAGWDGVGNAVDVYNRTAAGGTPTAPGTPGTPARPVVPVNNLGQTADIDALRAFFQQTAGFSREELAEKARQFNENLAQIERQWERDGKPRLEIDRDIQALRRQEVESQIGLATRAQGLAEELGRGRLGLETRAQSLAEELGRGRLGLDQGTLGLNYLTTASQMGGPADYFQSADFLRGARQRGDVPTFLGALRNNTQLPGFSGAGLTPPEAQTAAGLQAKLTGGSPISGYNTDQALAAIGNIFQRGATGLTPGSLEQLDPNELDLLKSGGRKLGYDPDAWLRAYSRAGVGQQAAAPY